MQDRHYLDGYPASWHKDMMNIHGTDIVAIKLDGIDVFVNNPMTRIDTFPIWQVMHICHTTILRRQLIYISL